VLVITKATIPANGSGETRLLAGRLLVELHLLVGSFVLLLCFLLGLQHVLSCSGDSFACCATQHDAPPQHAVHRDPLCR
jgi:hypothetical protein